MMISHEDSKFKLKNKLLGNIFLYPKVIYHHRLVKEQATESDLSIQPAKKQAIESDLSIEPMKKKATKSDLPF